MLGLFRKLVDARVKCIPLPVTHILRKVVVYLVNLNALDIGLGLLLAAIQDLAESGVYAALDDPLGYVEVPFHAPLVFFDYP